MERNDSILGGALLLTAANLLLRLISIAFQVFLSVRIGAAGLGLMQLISTIGVFAMLAGTAGVRVTAMYLAAEEFGHRRLSGVRAAMRACLQYGILVSAVSGAALFFLSDFFAQAWLRDLRAGPSLPGHGPAAAVFLPVRDHDGVLHGLLPHPPARRHRDRGAAGVRRADGRPCCTSGPGTIWRGRAAPSRSAAPPGVFLTSRCCICATGAICGRSRVSASRCESACCA